MALITRTDQRSVDVHSSTFTFLEKRVLVARRRRAAPAGYKGDRLRKSGELIKWGMRAKIKWGIKKWGAAGKSGDSPLSCAVTVGSLTETERRHDSRILDKSATSCEILALEFGCGEAARVFALTCVDGSLRFFAAKPKPAFLCAARSNGGAFTCLAFSPSGRYVCANESRGSCRQRPLSGSASSSRRRRRTSCSRFCNVAPAGRT
jgi:hypothetical protein